MNRIAVIIFALWLLPVVLLFPQETSGTSNFYDNPELKLDLPVFDLPYQIEAANIPGYNFFDSYTHPSMDLSLNITAGVYSAFHYGMGRIRERLGTDKLWKRLIYYGGTALGDYLSMYLLFVPPGYVWMHESFHRADFTHSGVGSHINFVFPIGAYAMADFGEFSYKYDLPRVYEAGLESEYLLIEKLQMNNFFYNQNMFNESLYWLANYQAWYYAYVPFLVDNLTMIVEGEEQEVATDSLVWAYILFHPDKNSSFSQEEADDDQTIGMSSLNDNEKEFLRIRTMLSLLNIASPMMFGVKSIPLGKDTGLYGNFSLRHFYTSFGTDSRLDLYVKRAPYNFRFVLHNYVNYEHYFPAVEAALVDFPLRPGMYLSPRVLIGVQPKDQGFFTADPEFFGLAGLRADFALSRNFLPYIEFTAKTDGWVAGSEFLEAAASVKLGISARF
jgi:hypothetical protein